MVGPGFTDGIDVSPGDAILAAHVDNLADNGETNREMADVDHDFDISTGDGYHRADADDPMHIKNEDGTPDIISFALHVDANGNVWIPVRKGDRSSVTNANADFIIQLADVPPGGIPA